MQVANFMQLRAGSPAHLSGSSIRSTGIPLGPVGFGGLQEDRPGVCWKRACARAVACRRAPWACCAAYFKQPLQWPGRLTCAATKPACYSRACQQQPRAWSGPSCFHDCCAIECSCVRGLTASPSKGSGACMAMLGRPQRMSASASFNQDVAAPTNCRTGGSD